MQVPETTDRESLYTHTHTHTHTHTEREREHCKHDIAVLDLDRLYSM
jgi:hypothetical protein